MILDKLNKVRQSKNIRNSFWIIGEQVFQMLLAFVVGTLSARYLGPSNYGTLNYTASFVSFFINIASLCMEGVVIKKLIDHPESEGVYLGSSLFFRIISSFLSMISIAIIVYILDPGDSLKLLLAAIQSIQLFFKSFHIFDTWFQRMLKSKYTSIGKMVASISVSGYKLFLLITSKSIIWFAFSTIISDLIIAVILYIFYKREGGQSLKINITVGKEVLSESYHFVLSDMMAALYMNMDKIMIGQMMTDRDVGLYIAATTISGLWAFIPVAMINSFRPTIIEIKKANESLYKVRLTQLFSIVIYTCFIFAIISFLFSELIVKILYGSDYIGAVEALRITVWGQMFAVISMVRNIWIICEDKNKYVKYYVAIGAVVNLVLNFILIPTIGIKGAAVSTFITSMVVLIFAPLLYSETRNQTRYLIDGVLMTWAWRRVR